MYVLKIHSYKYDITMMVQLNSTVIVQSYEYELIKIPKINSLSIKTGTGQSQNHQRNLAVCWSFLLSVSRKMNACPQQTIPSLMSSQCTVLNHFVYNFHLTQMNVTMIATYQIKPWASFGSRRTGINRNFLSFWLIRSTVIWVMLAKWPSSHHSHEYIWIIRVLRKECWHRLWSLS
jgi:hypothetical protein